MMAWWCKGARASAAKSLTKFSLNSLVPLLWRHNERDGESNHHPHDCLINCSFRHISASLAFVRGIHRWPVNSPQKGPVTWNIFPFDDIIMPAPNGLTGGKTRGCWHNSKHIKDNQAQTRGISLPDWYGTSLSIDTWFLLALPGFETCLEEKPYCTSRYCIRHLIL